VLTQNHISCSRRYNTSVPPIPFCSVYKYSYCLVLLASWESLPTLAVVSILLTYSLRISALARIILRIPYT
jgi:hypothetical protein